ncbi:ATP-binding cassette domain-containing protein [Siculibacillus lacustris]|uniref:ATP-binding cassette domain-containing protein n=1 Tax=Siculibacillus lacustris TaxID=1549641 RepID=A0A4Q9VVV5_9HYPH|nr:ATP-binding cassette domain-containing protein [Siculibacillus lacustris]TBW40310.1 ATP-binding cassette domain-containing protein [Siculibacillus lacustris]
MRLSFDGVTWGAEGEPVLGGVDLAVAAGELVVLVGRSGVGKSTVLRLAGGLTAPSGGRVRREARRVAMVFQEPRLLPWASALDNVALSLSALGLGRAAARARAAPWLARLGLSPRDLAKRPAALSGGMRARVAVARAFVIEPDLVLLDEPFAALDLALRRDLQAITRGLVTETGVAALFVTHDLPEAVRLADRLMVLDGRPARVVATLVQRPCETLADVWEAAAALSRRPELAAIAGDAAAPPRVSPR